MKIFCLHDEYGPGLPNSCTFVRILQPFSHPSVAHEISLEHGTSAPEGDPDVILIERHLGWPENTQLASLQSLVEDLRRRRIPLLYALDDNFLDLNIVRPWEPFPSGELRSIVMYLARSSDGVVVSTEALGQRMARLNENIMVVQNAIDERLFGPPGSPRKTSGALTIGYMGTLTHERDLMMILRPLRSVLKRHAGRLRLELVGVTANPRLLSLFEGVPVTFLDPGAEGAYPRFPAWMRRNLHWNIALSPLEDNAFTRCKSDLKYLDYGALGIAGVFSDVVPYRSVRDHETGLVVPNEPDAWERALEELVRDGELRTNLGCRARDEVYEKRTLAVAAVRWRDAVRALMPL
jgi:glycosyltransferase involved in cell wall biosynthesis